MFVCLSVGWIGCTWHACDWRTTTSFFFFFLFQLDGALFYLFIPPILYLHPKLTHITDTTRYTHLVQIINKHNSIQILKKKKWHDLFVFVLNNEYILNGIEGIAKGGGCSMWGGGRGIYRTVQYSINFFFVAWWYKLDGGWKKKCVFFKQKKSNPMLSEYHHPMEAMSCSWGAQIHLLHPQRSFASLRWV